MKYFLIFCSLIFLAGCAQTNNQQKLIAATLGGVPINLEVVDTVATRQQGLSGREALPPDQGMLFMFEQKGQPGFWMKDMRFALDFIWLSDGVVVEITPNVLPPSGDGELKIYTSSQPVNQVLEVNAGWTKQFDSIVGEQLQFK